MMEEKELNQLVAKMFTNIISFLERETEDCPHCGKHATGCEQIGRSVYARPCGCRVAQARLHDNWKTNDT